MIFIRRRFCISPFLWNVKIENIRDAIVDLTFNSPSSTKLAIAKGKLSRNSKEIFKLV
ncbi:hypothetical protein D3C87_2016870 [compost metagenome]